MEDLNNIKALLSQFSGNTIAIVVIVIFGIIYLLYKSGILNSIKLFFEKITSKNDDIINKLKDPILNLNTNITELQKKFEDISEKIKETSNTNKDEIKDINNKLSELDKNIIVIKEIVNNINDLEKIKIRGSWGK